MKTPPNILWLNTDHQLFANRPDVARNLPLQSWMAGQGTVFTRAYCALPVCSPSRASMLTGCYPHNHGLTENDGRFGGRAGLDPSDALFTDALRAAGYRCGWFGKWHLSNTHDAGAFGFEGFGPSGYAYPYQSPEYRTYLDRKGLPDPVVRVEVPGESGTQVGTRINLVERTDWFDYEAGAAQLESPVATHEAFFVADLAETWLRETPSPFFLRVDTWGPHPPYVVGPGFSDAFSELATAASPNLDSDLADRPTHHAAYRDYWRDTLDDAARDFALLSRRALQQAALCETAMLGLVDALQETGLLDNTVIVFSADHGDAVASNGGVLNKGGLLVEETLRIPLAMAGPGIARGAEDSLVCNVDVAPTLLDLCGIVPMQMDGENLMPLLHRTGSIPREGVLTEHYGLATPLWQRAFHKGRWKLVMQEDGFAELYNLETDPTEMRNLAQDPLHQETRARLLHDLCAALDAYGDFSPGAERLRRQATSSRRL